MNLLVILFGKLLSMISRFLNVGSGSTWPGHIALSVNKNFIKEIIDKNPQLKIILIAGTNGKTTTGKLIQAILEKDNKKVFQNESGANLLNGIASTLIHQCNESGTIDKDFGIFEIDENTLPLILKEISSPNFVIILNLFRDQLDRYGEVNTIAAKWKIALSKVSPKTKLILNADDPLIASLRLHPKGVSLKQALFFGLNGKKLSTFTHQHASDSTYCPNCGSKLSYTMTFYSHLGIWKCLECKNVRPQLDAKDAPVYPLIGVYNRYNTIAAVLLSRQLDVTEKAVYSALHEFKPAFGRQEILEIDEKRVQIFLSKNPTSLNESLRTIASLNAKNLLIVLNDRIPDGRDVSWIWDVDFEEVADLRRMKINVSGDRVFDIALRLKYADLRPSETQIHTDLKNAINSALKSTPENETLYILPTYSSMLETRKLLTGKEIL